MIKKADKVLFKTNKWTLAQIKTYGQGFDQACHPFFFGVTGRNNK